LFLLSGLKMMSITRFDDAKVLTKENVNKKFSLLVSYKS